MRDVGFRPLAIIFAGLSGGLAIPGGSHAGDLKPYVLPPAARARVEDLAASSDLLILGEIHGTREVPALVAGLLSPLTERGYRTLAIEVPNDQQAPLLAWARGESDRAPGFFADPNGDGRGNVQLLELVRIAASPPFRWRVVCFDESEANLDKRYQALIREKQAGGRDLAQLTADDAVAEWRGRDAVMASNLLREAASLKSSGKILAICGNLHACTKHDEKDPIASKFWPSFAEMARRGQPARRVNSVDVEFASGGYFNEEKVQTIRGRPIEQAEVRSTDQDDWDLVLRLPEASPATFLPPGPARAKAGPPGPGRSPETNPSKDK